MLADLPYLYLFWSAIFILGFVNLPLTSIFFKKFIDRGYIFAKIIGIVLLAYSVCFLSLLKLLPFSQTSIIAVGVFWLLVNLVIYKKNRLDLTIFFNRLSLFEELLFLGFFVFWSYVRGFAPDIHGLEKFMDFGFINSILRTYFMPPLDMWLASSSEYPYHFINYYYFGHFTTALLTKLTQIPAEVSYNLMLGVICGFTFSGVFSIVLNLFFYVYAGSVSNHKNLLKNRIGKREIILALLAGYLVTFGGNLHTIYAFTRGYSSENPKPFWQVLGVPNFDAYWYPNATRFIKNTIHEFPSYSFIVSDLHGHVLDIPFVLLTIAFLFSIFISVKLKHTQKFSINNTHNLQFKIIRLKLSLTKAAIKKIAQNLRFLIFNFYFLIFLGLLLAVMHMTNAWDGIIYFGLSVLILMVGNTKIHQVGSLTLDRKLADKNYQQKFRIGKREINFYWFNFAFNFFILLITFFLFSLPFNRTFIPFAKGIGINCITPNANGQVLCDHSPWWMLFILWGYFYFFAVSLIFALKKSKNLNLTDIFVLILVFLATLLLIAPEFIFARDIYPLHYRANTMFKLGYQAFIMLAMVVAYSLFRLSRPAWWWKLGAYLQLFLVCIYPIFGLNSYYNGLRKYQGLDGIAWLRRSYPWDKQAIDYLRKNLGEFDQPVILEAVGESYSDYARISAYTGLPTVLGWPVHEWLWRGSYDEAGKRQEEVRKIYEATNVKEAENLLKKYQVKYVIVSSLEQQKYSKINVDNFENLGRIVFQSGPMTIYQIEK